MANEIFRLEIDVTGDAVKELKQINNSLKRTEKTTKSLQKTFKGFGALLALGVGSQVVQEFAELSSQAQQMNDRFKLITDSSAELERSLELVRDGARESRSDLISYGNSFTNIALATEQYNLSADELNTITQTLNKSFKLSGTSAEGTAGAMTQLVQGLNSGALRGEEFNSIAENNPILMKLMAEELNVTTGELRKMAGEGKLTADVLINSIANGADDVSQKFNLLSPTVEDVSTTFKNEMTNIVSEINKLTLTKTAIQGSIDLFEELGKAAITTVQRIEIAMRSTTVASEFENMFPTADQLKLAIDNVNAALDGLPSEGEDGFVGPLLPKPEETKAATEQIKELSNETVTYAETLRIVPDEIENINEKFKEMEDVTTGIFNQMADSLSEFVLTGKTSFSDLVNSIAEDLLKLAIQKQILDPILGGLFSGATNKFSLGLSGSPSLLPATGGSLGVASAKGNVFGPSGVQAFAKGGVVSSPTVFPFAKGVGLMGEAGPEAILPLKRKNGVLGVEGGGSNVSVNIINQSGGEVSTNERQDSSGSKVIDVLIAQSVNKGLSQGFFDKSLSNSFGVNRKGRL